MIPRRGSLEFAAERYQATAEFLIMEFGAMAMKEVERSIREARDAGDDKAANTFLRVMISMHALALEKQRQGVISPEAKSS